MFFKEVYLQDFKIILAYRFTVSIYPSVSLFITIMVDLDKKDW